MVETVALAGALACSVSGMALLALAMKPHWDQARAPVPYPSDKARTLRALGVTALAVALGLCLFANHLSMAPLVWVMGLTAAALIVAFTLAYRPRWLGWLVAWMR